MQQNVAAIVDPPKVEAAEIEILTEDQIRAVLAALRATTSLYPLICLALATGMRRCELCALRWGDVDLEGGSLRVEQSLEQTAAGLRFKSPKTKHGRRSISLPAYAVAELKAHWANQNEKRLAMGLGKAPEGALVFCHGDGEPLKPDNLSKEWRRLVKVRKLPRVTFHALRHTHASQLIAAGVDVLTLSRRLGHGSPAITLGVYGHIFGDSDDKAARALEAAFQRAKTD